MLTDFYAAGRPAKLMEGKEEDERTYNRQKNLRSSGPSVGFVISLRAGFLCTEQNAFSPVVITASHI